MDDQNGKDQSGCSCGPDCDCCCSVCSKPLDDKDFKDNCVCCYCADAEGNIKSYEELVTGMTGYFKSQGMGDDDAAKKAKETIDTCKAMKDGKIKK